MITDLYSEGDLDARELPAWGPPSVDPDNRAVFWIYQEHIEFSESVETSEIFWAWGTIDSAHVVPVPGAVWLFGSALGLFGWMKRKSA